MNQQKSDLKKIGLVELKAYWFDLFIDFQEKKAKADMILQEIVARNKENQNGNKTTSKGN